MKSKNIKTHFGVYGVCMMESKILCIKKSKGPYKNRFDLPGGSQKENESLVETLYREVNEETSQNIDSFHPFITVDFFAKSTDSPIVHHIAVLYTINITQYHTKVSTYVNNEINDSKGYVWIDTNKLNDTNASPIILELLYYLNFSTINSRSEYPRWQIL